MSTGEQDLESPTSTLESEGAEAESPETEKEEEKHRLDLDVQISDVGPCKKHLKVAVAKSEIERQFNESLGTLKREAAVPGFRPGRAPRQLVEKKFRKEVADQVKSTLLMSALEQIDKEYNLNPITQPDFDIAAIELPAEGPMRFEMEVEVRPDFPLPEYKSLKVKRPVKTINDKDVDDQLKYFLERYAPVVPKEDEGAAFGDFIVADLKFLQGDRVINEAKEIEFRLQPELRFQDGTMPDIGKDLMGVKPGETRQTRATIGSGSPDPSLRGQALQVELQVNDLKTLRLPEVNSAFLNGIGFDSEEDLRTALRGILQRRFESQQRQGIRRDVMTQILENTPFDMPNDLVTRQTKATVRRLAMELRQEGLKEEDIRAREAEIRANAHETTLRSLKEFFLLSKVAEAEKITVEDSDMEDELEVIAARSDESVRRVRARFEKEGLGEALASQILERKTIDKILEHVTFEDVPLDEEGPVSTLDQSVGTETEEPEAEAEPSSPTEPAAEASASTPPDEGETSEPGPSAEKPS